MNTDTGPRYVAHDCKLCPKKNLIGPHYLNHLRYAHPVQYQNWIASKAEFGMSGILHFPFRETEGVPR